MLSLTAIFLTGLALFLVGVADVSANLRKMTSRAARRVVARSINHPALAALSGFGFGALTQSASAVAFLMVGLISSGMITVRQALPLVSWANLGVTVLVFMAAVDIKTATFWLLGVTGLLIAFQIGSRHRNLLQALFAVGLLFLGLNYMKEAFKPLPEFEWFGMLASFLQGSVFAAFVVGALLRLMIQSSSAIAIIAITLTQSGLFSGTQAAMVLFGTGLGVTLSVLLLSTNLKGVPRQIAFFQAGINGCSSLLLLFLSGLELAFGLPGPLQLAHQIPGGQSTDLACAFLVLQATTVVIGLAAGGRIAPWLERLSPATTEEDISKPQFIQDETLEDPGTALLLLEREQFRFASHLPVCLDPIREEKLATGRLRASDLHAGLTGLGGELKHYTGALLEKNLDRDSLERVLLLERRTLLLLNIEEILNQFVETRKSVRPGLKMSSLFDSLTEGIVTLLTLTLDAASGTREDLDMVLSLTSDRGDMMERLRRQASSEETEASDPGQKASLFYMTTLFERLVWLLRQQALSFETDTPSPDRHNKAADSPDATLASSSPVTTPTEPLPELTILPLGNDLECVQVTGRLDPLGVQSIETKFMAHTAARRKPVIIDLSGVSYMNSLSIRLLMENAKALRLHKADLVLFVPPGDVRHVLELTGVLNILKAGATLDEAKALLGI